MTRKKRDLTLLLIALAVLVLAFAVTYGVNSSKQYNKRLASEKLTQVDFYSMQDYCSKNAEAVMGALKTGNVKKLEPLLSDPKNAEALMSFADWKNADFEKAVTLGAGSLTEKPDNKGRMDISEKFIVDVGDVKYVLFVETLTSRWGMNNEGVTAVAATTYGHFDGTEFAWNGEADDQSVLAGKLWWNRESTKKK